ncbi:class I SAM-dependent RNA methyltransferase [Synechocystis sp. PCC 7339]|uniref:THUMP domain-containing class I SAM-dependent RNA methyltransferase n=1 Tax=unclassified Synechocystis TaxID=2640012 RepID=UPI001BAEDD3D|nr:MULTISPECIES: class I SAM-dependent RNA methyltransferase [unclassified Synechocystis]QUS60686.1 class I SAM-dependent RNA methyltransferase [Synechocystis sp. PCC 7338]UAJ72870.1 class I SAM-dependent RNA methyltransferase [Synechocystis sp. PCC 7339]
MLDLSALSATTRPYFATVARGLEEIAAQELSQLGAEQVKPEFAGVAFMGDRALLYRINLWSRLIYRVLMPMATVKAFNAQDLYRSINKIDWDEYLSLDQTIQINCTGKNPQLNHSHFTALQVKNAIVDQQRDRHQRRSSVDLEQPDIVINAHIHQNHCQLSLDSTGFSLHRRGYRPAMGQAPLKETLASALLTIAEWNPEHPLYDPLCGSGTFLLEAGLQSLNIAPGKFQPGFCFQQWPDFDQDLWQYLLEEAKAGEKDTLQAPLWGSDGDREVIQEAQSNAQQCQLGGKIHWQQLNFADIEPPAPEGVLICNPPYGKRIGQAEALGDFYQQIGDVLKQRFKGWTAFVLSGDKALTKRIGLRTSARFPINNGGLPCTLLKYELY